MNGDCAVTLEDVRIVQLMVQGCLPPNQLADFDGDGDVDLDDLLLYAEYVLGGD